MDSITISKPNKIVTGSLQLEGSKSISNRALLIRALSETDFDIQNLSISDDTNILTRLLSQEGTEYDTGHAGTCYRFMTAYLALKDGKQVLTGSERMKERPIGPLVNALRTLGADIKYLENEGYPPLEIGKIDFDQYKKEVSISGSVSSQYLSALLMIAPRLPNGIELEITGDLVSRPYLEMTVKMLKYFGIEHLWEENTITIKNQSFIPKDYLVESDWSAASYHYEIAALSDEAEIELHGLFEDSLQGDRAIADISEAFGVATEFKEKSIVIRKKESLRKDLFEYNFIKQPDLAQSVAVMSSGLGIYSIFSGLETLKIKETNRIVALQNELGKFGTYLSLLPKRFSQKSDEEYYAINGKASADELQSVETYKDHRMALAFAPLAIQFPITILKPAVVNKSYSSYWEHLEQLGFEMKE